MKTIASLLRVNTPETVDVGVRVSSGENELQAFEREGQNSLVGLWKFYLS